jgi:hypothetical protein
LIIDESTYSPTSGTARDFTNPVTYTVTAENGTTKPYTVTVNLAERTADSDGDGFSDGWEVDSGNDPLNPQDHPVIDLTPYIPVPVAGEQPVLDFTGQYYDGTIVWKIGGSTFTGTTFGISTQYTAEVILTPKSEAGYAFTGTSYTVIHTGGTGNPFTGGKAGNNLTVSIPFPATASPAGDAFRITINSGSDSSFILPIKPDTTNNLTVEWGDGTTQTITTAPSTGTNRTGIPHTYPAANTNYYIRMYGTSVRANALDDGICGFGFGAGNSGYNTAANRGKVRNIDSDILSLLPPETSLGAMFLRNAFYDCTALTSISGDFLSGVTGLQGAGFLQAAFYGCTALTGIPDGFLSGVTGSQGASFLQAAFYGCTALTSIPASFLSGITGSPQGISFLQAAFYDCTALASASPVNDSGVKLYTRVSGINVGKNCFYGCTQMADYASIPDSWKNGQ